MRTADAQIVVVRGPLHTRRFKSDAPALVSANPQQSLQQLPVEIERAIEPVQQGA